MIKAKKSKSTVHLGLVSCYTVPNKPAAKAAGAGADEAQPTGKINPFSKIAVTFDAL